MTKCPTCGAAVQLTVAGKVPLHYQAGEEVLCLTHDVDLAHAEAALADEAEARASAATPGPWEQAAALDRVRAALQGQLDRANGLAIEMQLEIDRLRADNQGLRAANLQLRNEPRPGAPVGHLITVGYTTMDDGIWLNCICGWSHEAGFGATPWDLTAAAAEHYGR